MARLRLAEWEVPHLHVDKLGEQLGSETDQATQGTSTGKQSLKTTDLRNLWGLRWGKKLTASWEKSLERPTGS